MKQILFILLLLAGAAVAQNPPPGMPSESAMKNMMQQAQRMQTCMAGVDQAQLEALGKKAEALSAEIDALCGRGQESEALQKAIEFSLEMNADPTVQEVRKCTEGMPEMMAGLMPDFDPAATAAEEGDSGICDD